MENGVMIQYFEWNLPNDGKLWDRIKNDARHLAEVGITSVWIPPAYKADEQEDEGYATYDLYDLGEFDQKGTIRTKYGTKQELKSMIAELHKYKISVYLDAVMNHKAGADYTENFTVQEVNPKQRHEQISEPYEIEGWTGYDFPGRGNKYSDFKWHWYHFSGTDFDQRNKKTAIYQILGEGKAWSKGVDTENGNYDYLLCNDIDLDNQEAIEELEHWGVWVSNELNLDGMRLDAIKHMEHKFMKKFLETVRINRGEQFYAVGEYWSRSITTLKKYLKILDYNIDLFDVPLHYNMHEASKKGSKYDLQKLIKGSLIEAYPDHAVTFVDNHDSQEDSSLESEVKNWFKPLAYGVILLMQKGYPCIFYGDYYNIKKQESPHRNIIDVLLDVRKNYAYGEQRDYFDNAHIVGFTRMGDKKHPGSGLVYLISNDKGGKKRMYVGGHRNGEVWTEITGNITKEVVIDKDGYGEFEVGNRNMSIWLNNK